MPLAKMDKLTRVDLMKVRLSTYATCLTFVALLALALGFAGSHWLECKTIQNQRFRRLGLWEACFEKLHDHHYRYDRIITGCKWIFDQDYSFMIDFLEPTFFIITQVLYTAGFLLLVLVCAGILAVQQCFVIEREDYALRALSVASSLSALACTSAVVIFAINGDREDWMPDAEHSFFSWSFAAAVIGSFLMWVAALLFYIEMQLVIRKIERQNSQSSR